MKRLDVPGVAIGIWHKGKEYAEGFGITSAEHPLPVTSDTLFQTGSISKTFTGTMMMKLVEDGKVDLDAPVKTYIKDFKVKDKDVTKRVTVRHLLTHMGGWVGDHKGLASVGNQFLTFFSQPHGSDPSSVFFRRVGP